MRSKQAQNGRAYSGKVTLRQQLLILCQKVPKHKSGVLNSKLAPTSQSASPPKSLLSSSLHAILRTQLPYVYPCTTAKQPVLLTLTKFLISSSQCASRRLPTSDSVYLTCRWMSDLRMMRSCVCEGRGGGGDKMQGRIRSAGDSMQRREGPPPHGQDPENDEEGGQMGPGNEECIIPDTQHMSSVHTSMASCCLEFNGSLFNPQ